MELTPWKFYGPLAVTILACTASIGCLYYARDHALTAREQLKIMQSDKAKTAPGATTTLTETGDHMIPFIISVATLVIAIGGLAFIAIKFKPPLHMSAPQEIARHSVVSRAFSIMKAEWGRDNTRAQVEDAISQMPPNALAFYLCPDALKPYTTPGKADPALGPGKIIDITYSSEAGSGTIHRKEGEWIVLPEDPHLKEENRHLGEQLQELQTKYENITKRFGEDDDLKGVDDSTFRLYKNSFPQIWQQRLALKWLSAVDSYTIDEFRNVLKVNSPDSDATLKAAISTLFVEQKDERIWIKPGEAKRILKQLFRDQPLCP